VGRFANCLVAGLRTRPISSSSSLSLFLSLSLYILSHSLSQVL
jgi:hypothetical protein